MSHVTFMEPIANLTGKVKRSSNISHRTSYGVQHTYTWNPENVIRETPARLIHREALAQANAFASSVLSTGDKQDSWHQQYRKSRYVGPINSFIIRQVLPDIKARLQTEWKDRPIDELKAYISQQRNLRYQTKLIV